MLAPLMLSRVSVPRRMSTAGLVSPVPKGRAMMRTLTPITLQEVSFAFAENPILDRFTLHIEPGRIGGATGPFRLRQKSTLLRLLAGLKRAGQRRKSALATGWSPAQDGDCPRSSAISAWFFRIMPSGRI